MTVEEIKSEIGLSALHWEWAEDEDGVVSEEWMRHWDNDRRISVSVHKDTIEKVEANPEISTLGFHVKDEERTAKKSGETYTFHRIVCYKDPVVVW